MLVLIGFYGLILYQKKRTINSMKTQQLVAKHQMGAILSTIHLENPESMEEKRPYTITYNPLVYLRMKPEREVLQKAIHNP